MGGGVELVESVPLTVWEQYGLVVLVLITFSPLVFFLIRWLLSWSSRERAASDKQRLEERNQWQKFIVDRDQFLQKMTADMTAHQEAQSIADRAALERVARAVEGFGVRLEEHDDNVTKRLDEAAKKVIDGVAVRLHQSKGGRK